jgi:transcriptional regulator with XRE-family HTH domain
LRERALVSQEELAARAGVSVRAIGNLEQGRVGQPRGVSVRLLADALGLVGPERRRFEDAARQRLEDAGRSVPEGLGGVSAGSWPASQRLAPCQVPPEVADFTGRTEQVTRLGGLVAAATELWPPQVQELGFRAMALDELGRLRILQGRYDQAIEHLTEAARLWQQLGAAASQARTLTVLGDTLATAGHAHQARAARHQAGALQQFTWWPAR